MKTIAVDIDDVLSVSVPEFIAYSNKKWGTHLTAKDYTEHWAALWRVDNATTTERSIDFHRSSDFTAYKPIVDGEAVLRELAARYRLVVTTARNLQIQKDTLQWIDTHFSGVFSEVHFAGIWDTITDESPRATKAELCKQLGADYLIDDQLKHCVAAAAIGVRAVLFGAYPWNRADQLPNGVVRCDNWRQVEAYFEREY